MEVRDPVCIGCGDHRVTIRRSGMREHETRTYADRTEEIYSDFASETMLTLVRDREGAVQRISAERYRTGDILHRVRREATGRYGAGLGEHCVIWTVIWDYGRQERCETADGIPLWTQELQEPEGTGMARAIAIERRPVRPGEVRPPRDFFSLAPWPSFGSGSGATGYEVELRSTSRGESRVQMLRADGTFASGHIDTGGGARHSWARDPRFDFHYTTETDGRPGALEVGQPSSRAVRLRRTQRWMPLAGRQPQSVLGERCTWQEDENLQSTDAHYECRTGDGIALMLEDHWHWDSVVDVYTARRVVRRRLDATDLAPPAAATDWSRWGIVPAPD
jgi:hypothetical protein